MKRLQRSCGAALGGLLFAFAVLGVAQDKTEPPAGPKAVPSGFRMYLVADGRLLEEANEKKDPDKKSVSSVRKDKDVRDRIGKLHDPVTELGLNTVIAVFARGVPKDQDDPAIKVLKFEQDLAKKYRVRRLGAFMAFLALKKDFADDDERFDRITEIETLAKAAMVPLVQVGLAEVAQTDEKVPPQVTAWGIGAGDSIVIVLYHRFKIVKRWQFKADAPPTDKELQELSDEVDAIMGKKKE